MTSQAPPLRQSRDAFGGHVSALMSENRSHAMISLEWAEIFYFRQSLG